MSLWRIQRSHVCNVCDGLSVQRDVQDVPSRIRHPKGRQNTHMLCVIDCTRCEYHSITIILLLWPVVRAVCAVQKCKAQRCSPPLQFICAARAVFVGILVRVKWLSSFSHEFSIKSLCTDGARFSLYLFKFLRAAWAMNRQECAANTSYIYLYTAMATLCSVSISAILPHDWPRAHKFTLYAQLAEWLGSWQPQICFALFFLVHLFIEKLKKNLLFLLNLSEFRIMPPIFESRMKKSKISIHFYWNSIALEQLIYSKTKMFQNHFAAFKLVCLPKMGYILHVPRERDRCERLER